MRILSALAVIAVLVTIFMSATVLAAKPNNQACLGKDFSGYAQGGADFGAFISGLASSTGLDGQTGIGGEIQLHLAGLVPDSTIPNSCNN